MTREETVPQQRWSALLDNSLSTVPPRIADALVLAQYARVHGQLPWLHFSIAVMTIAGVLTDFQEARTFVELAVAALILIAVTLRWLRWQRAPKQAEDAAKASRSLRIASLVILLVVAPVAFWIMTELQAEPDDQKDLVMLLVVLGSFATASCYAWYPPAALIPLLLGCMPIALLLLQMPDLHAVALGMAVIMITVQQARLIMSRYQELIEMLCLQHDMADLAQTDPLTGLANRRALNDALEAAIASATPAAQPVLAMLDLDGFKPVNDRHGHAAGDEILRQVALRIRTAAGPDAVVARLGGDEFAILFSGPASARAEGACHALVSSFAVPFTYDDHLIRLGVSLGTARCDTQDARALALMDAADQALYAVKEEHRAGSRRTISTIRPVAA